MKQIFGKMLLEWLVGEGRKDKRKKEKDRKKEVNEQAREIRDSESHFFLDSNSNC